MKPINEEKVQQQWVDLRRKKFSQIEEVLANFDFDAQVMLSSFVASVCDVDEAEMLADTEHLYVSQARWLYWYVMRQAWYETYEWISHRTALGGTRFSKDGVRKGCEKMSRLIDQNKLWKGRYTTIRRFLALLENPQDYFVSDFTEPLPQRYKISLSVPRELKDAITIEVKDK